MMKTILLITARFDPAADLLLAELRRRGAPCARWNTDHFPLDSVLTYQASNSEFRAQFVSDDRKIDFAAIGSVWWQWDLPAGFPAELGVEERRFAETESQLALAALTTIGDFLWINHPKQERSAKSKPAQLFAAREVGLDIPRTLVTNDPDAVRQFVAGSGAQIVYKGLSQPRDVEPGKALFTGLLTRERLAEIDLIRFTPGIFQERVEKSHELRVTVIGSRIFSAKIESQALAQAALDWRPFLQDLKYEAIQLPPEIEAKILALMKIFGLVYGAFDFIVTPDGRYVFLEVNPSGQYMWIECATGLEITAALADALMAPCRP
jgi:glutathione synthase/RimK-type ligase-like ATP-grasp enzyme